MRFQACLQKYIHRNRSYNSYHRLVCSASEILLFSTKGNVMQLDFCFCRLLSDNSYFTVNGCLRNCPPDCQRSAIKVNYIPFKSDNLATSKSVKFCYQYNDNLVVYDPKMDLYSLFHLSHFVVVTFNF